MVELDIDNLASRLLNVGAVGGRLTVNVNEQELSMLCFKAKQVFMAQNSLVEVMPPVIVCGDIHGQFSDLLRIFDKNGFPPEVNYMFLGDYVDRGRQNIETIALMFCLKIKYPENFFMLRGNHECPAINRVYGFYEECNRRYKSTVSGAPSRTLSTGCRWLVSSEAASSACTAAYLPLWRASISCAASPVRRTLRTPRWASTSSGPTLTFGLRDGRRTLAESRTSLDRTLCRRPARNWTWIWWPGPIRWCRTATSFSPRRRWSPSSLPPTTAASSTTLPPR